MQGVHKMVGFCCAARLRKTDAGEPYARSACRVTWVWLDALQRLASLQLLEALHVLFALQLQRTVLYAATRSCSCQLPGVVEEHSRLGL